jgi:16S rRNA processing protein RimM
VDEGTVSIGRLGAPKGVRGDLKVHSYSGESAHFRKLKVVELRGQDAGSGAPRSFRLPVLRVEGEGPSLTIAFEGYPSPESARVLTGLDIVVPRAQAAKLKPNEWYIDDLVGLSLLVGGEKKAEVLSILEGGAEPWLEVAVLGAPAPAPAGRRAKGAAAPAGPRTAIVPFRKEFVGAVDLGAGTIELLVPELLSPDGPPDE